jgi:hypothetical protein
MGLLSRTLSRCTGVMLVCALLAPPSAIASPKPLTPERVQARLLKCGLGNWVAVQVLSGAAFGGRLVSIDDHSFGLQLHNDPAITTVLYSNVVDMQAGLSRRGFWTLVGISFGAMGAAAGVGFYEVHKHSQMPTLPSLPTQPVFP